MIEQLLSQFPSHLSVQERLIATFNQQKKFFRDEVFLKGNQVKLYTFYGLSFTIRNIYELVTDANDQWKDHQLLLVKDSPIPVKAPTYFMLAELSPYMYDDPSLLEEIFNMYCTNFENYLKFNVTDIGKEKRV